MNSDDWFLTSVIAVGLIAGCSIVSFMANRLKSQERTASCGKRHVGQSQQEGKEEKYARVLGVSATADEADVKRAYRLLMTKYHPDKVKHLGAEFTSIAEVRTREILEACNYFQKKHDIR